MPRHYRPKYIARNSLTPRENRALGRQVWAFIMLLLVLSSIKLWGTDIFFEWWFDILILFLGEVAYRFTGWLLRALRIWYY